MSFYDELPVYKATYDLLLEMFWFTKDFSKEYKYTVGESLKKETVELITLIYRANSRLDKQATLQTAREEIPRSLQQLRTLHHEAFSFFAHPGHRSFRYDPQAPQ